MKNYFNRLYHYNRWANQLFSEVILKHTPENAQIHRLFSHIGNAQRVWLNRILNTDADTPGVFEVFSLIDSAYRLKQSSQDWIDFIKKEENFDQTISYYNSRGESFISPLQDINLHVANHSTHHRGQLAMLLREEEITPPASDYIFFIRNN